MAKGEYKDFNISLEINLSAKTPLEAAKQLEKMLEEQAKGWQFYVQEAGQKEIFSVDLEESDEDAITECKDYQPVIKN